MDIDGTIARSILIDRGVVQCIAPRDQSAGDWPTEVMPSGTMLAPGFIDLQVNGAAESFSMMSQRRTRCAPLLEHIAGTAPQAAYLL
jgi:N-acetylglucosamine-6-phosphate deacetylase